MSDIELVVRISEEDLDCIKYLKAKGWASRHELQILNGIPLPKGHGYDVLDKIRAEIESQREEASKKHSEDEGLSNYYFGLNDGLKDARDIIDKYIADKEQKV